MMVSLHNGLAVALLWAAPSSIGGFTSTSFTRRTPPSVALPTTASNPALQSPLFQQKRASADADDHDTRSNVFYSLQHRWKSLQRRLVTPTTETAGLGHLNVQHAGLFGATIKRVHDPITYFCLFMLFGIRHTWCFRNPFFWFAVAFCVKWYRARYVFKIPVWDRQPNWNNVITSKEQEKDLKAYTCKNCGSTIFIAKTREFFFEGSTGIGGLGCFSCGAKGKDNFVMDRDRIVEDVADMDDYFDYEQPLDFVSRAERRKILKETQGDEELANKLLIERSGGAATGTEEEPAVDNSGTNGEGVEAAAAAVENPVEAESVEEETAEDDTTTSASTEEENPVEEPTIEEEPEELEEETVAKAEEATVEAEEPVAQVDEVGEPDIAIEPVAPPKVEKKQPPPAPTPAPAPAPKPAVVAEASDDDFDVLGI